MHHHTGYHESYAKNEATRAVGLGLSAIFILILVQLVHRRDTSPAKQIRVRLALNTLHILFLIYVRLFLQEQTNLRQARRPEKVDEKGEHCNIAHFEKLELLNKYL